VVGAAQGVTVIDDFGHHPTAITCTLRALRDRFGRGKLVAVFEPRSATSRRKVFQAELADALAHADEAVIAAPFAPERIPPEERLDPKRLVADLAARKIAASYQPELEGLVEHLATRVSPGDTLVFFSSGPFGGVHDRLLDRLGDAVTPGRAEDGDAIGALLDAAGLPRLDFESRLGDFLVVRSQGRVIGCVGLEIHGEACLLRSLAVVPERRGEGLGWVLVDAALGRARGRGCRRAFLFTETAAHFFADKVGFSPIAIEQADPALRASQEFQCCTERHATCMMLDLRPREQKALG
jgi:UDP-N-acetylmuramate: L-alanyl-gamma-D-glutamyl-meso-diaminopimelate ligase